MHLRRHGMAVWMAALAWSVAAVASAATPNDLSRAEQAMFAASGAHGMVVAVIDQGHTRIDGYGESYPGSGQKPDAHSLLRIGSLSKLLADDLLVKLATEGRLRLTDMLTQHAPQGYTHSVNAASITLLELATHTSGLPRTLLDSPRHVPAMEQRWQWLQTSPRRPAAGTQALYSNLAYDLLGDALAAAAGQSYIEALRQRVLQPLGMGDTTAEPDASQCARLMRAEPAAPSACDNGLDHLGSAGFYSTAADMSGWMRQQLGLDSPSADSERSIAQAIYFPRQALPRVEGMDIGGHADGLGLGWVAQYPMASRPYILEKTGGGNGFMTYLALVPGRGTGIFVVVDRVDVPMLTVLAQQANNLLGHLAPPSRIP